MWVWVGRRSCTTCLKQKNNVHRHSRTLSGARGWRSRSHPFESTLIRTRWAIISQIILARRQTSITSSACRAIVERMMRGKTKEDILVGASPLTYSRTSSCTIRSVRTQEGDRVKIKKSVESPLWVARKWSVPPRVIIELVYREAAVVLAPPTMQRASSSTTRVRAAINRTFSGNSSSASLSKTTASCYSQRCLTNKNMKSLPACIKVSALRLLEKPYLSRKWHNKGNHLMKLATDKPLSIKTETISRRCIHKEVLINSKKTMRSWSNSWDQTIWRVKESTIERKSVSTGRATSASNVSTRPRKPSQSSKWWTNNMRMKASFLRQTTMLSKRAIRRNTWAIGQRRSSGREQQTQINNRPWATCPSTF